METNDALKRFFKKYASDAHREPIQIIPGGIFYQCSGKRFAKMQITGFIIKPEEAIYIHIQKKKADTGQILRVSLKYPYEEDIAEIIKSQFPEAGKE